MLLPPEILTRSNLPVLVQLHLQLLLHFCSSSCSGPKSASVDEVCLLTADGSPMVCSGSRIIPLQFSCGSGSKVYMWNFQLAYVSVPLLGADFLQHFNLLVNIKGQQVVYADCPVSVILQASPGPQPAFRSVAFLSAPQPVKKLMEDFPDVLSSDGLTASKPRHKVRLSSPNQPWSSSFCQTSKA